MSWRRAWLLGVAAALAAAAPARASACTPLDPDRLGWRLTFHEDFAEFDPHRPGRWATSFVWGGRTIPGNKEQQVYVDPGFRGDGDRPLGLNPFARDGGRLAITASPLERGLREAIKGFSYTSGLLTTSDSFRQAYGYFEIRARLPAGKGLWPAFWLLQPAGKWPPEIDVFEVLGHHPERLYVSVHSADRGRKWSKTIPVAIADSSADFHAYAVLWTAERITWFFDRCPVAELPTPADLHEPMYLLINLAVGGMAGTPNRRTRFPARLVVDRVTVYALP